MITVRMARAQSMTTHPKLPSDPPGCSVYLIPMFFRGAGFSSAFSRLIDYGACADELIRFSVGNRDNGFQRGDSFIQLLFQFAVALEYNE